ncbi:MAG: hypothetical protein ACFNYI_05760, partial [Eubacterium sp.]
SLKKKHSKTLKAMYQNTNIALRGFSTGSSHSGVRTPQEQSYATTFAISGIVAVLEQWIREPDDSTTAEDHADLVCRITGSE